MRISDWSSDVCSSDLFPAPNPSRASIFSSPESKDGLPDQTRNNGYYGPKRIRTALLGFGHRIEDVAADEREPFAPEGIGVGPHHPQKKTRGAEHRVRMTVGRDEQCQVDVAATLIAFKTGRASGRESVCQ